MTTSSTKAEESALKFTYEDYLHLPSDGKRYEIIEGELFMTPAPTTKHQRISLRLERALDDFVTTNKLGQIFHAPCDVVFSDINVVQPDILFISNERSSIITEENIRGAPDLVVEILSPYSDKVDRMQKRQLYATFGVKEYWIVDPEQKTIEVLTVTLSGYETHGTYEGAQTLRSPLLAGLEILLVEIFAK